MKKDYLVVVAYEFVRDAQVAMSVDADPMDGGDDWGDAQAELVIGTFPAESSEKAIEYACAENIHIIPEILTTYLLADNQPKG